MLRLVPALLLAGCLPDPTDRVPAELPRIGFDTEGAVARVFHYAERAVEAHAVPGAAVALYVEGHLYTLELGSELLDGGSPVSVDTQFHLGSVAMQFTAATALALQDDLILDLNAPITDTLPWFTADGAFSADDITLDHLLTHASGYPTRLDVEVAEDELEPFFQAVSGEPLWAEPGAVFNYTPLGYSLAALVIEEAAEQPFASLRAERILGRAGLSGSDAVAAAAAGSGIAVGHSDGYGAGLPIELIEPASLVGGTYAPQGGLWMSMADLARWGGTLLEDGGLALGPAAAEGMLSPLMPTTPTDSGGYGHGLLVYGGADVAGHGSDTWGTRTEFLVIPEIDLAVAVAVNGDWYDAGAIAWEAVAAFSDGLHPAQPIPAKGAIPFHGSYYDPTYFGRVDVMDYGPWPWVYFFDLGFDSYLYPVGPETFWFYLEPDDIWAEGTFWSDEDGPRWFVTYLGVAERQ